MKYLLRLFNHFKPIPKVMPVGRWNNDCKTKTNKKIDFSNEDHCGPCGQNLLNSSFENKQIKDEIFKRY